MPDGVYFLVNLHEASQRSAKIKIYLNFLSSSGIGTGRVTKVPPEVAVGSF